LVLDFRDAFKQLHVHPDEQRFLSGTLSQGWFAYLRVLFGVVTGPRGGHCLQPSATCGVPRRAVTEDGGAFPAWGDLG
jgi:hypothetical protein